MAIRKRLDRNGRAKRPSTLEEAQRAEAERLLIPLCHVEPHAGDRLRIAFRFDGPAVILFESRPRFQKPLEWGTQDVAKFRYVKQHDVWRLFCQHSDLRWHTYEALPEANSLAQLVLEVEDDQYGIFWG